MTVPQTEPPPEPIIPDPTATAVAPDGWTSPRPEEDEDDREMTDDELVDEQGKESFPASDPPSH